MRYHIEVGTTIYRRKPAADVDEREWEKFVTTRAATYADEEYYSAAEPGYMRLPGSLKEDDWMVFNLPLALAAPYVQFVVHKDDVNTREDS